MLFDVNAETNSDIGAIKTATLGYLEIKPLRVSVNIQIKATAVLFVLFDEMKSRSTRVFIG